MESEKLRQNVIVAAQNYYNDAFKAKPFVAGETYIPATAKLMDFGDMSALLDASMDMWLTAGRYARDLESQLPGHLGQKSKALLVNSGSSANLLAVSSLTSPLMTDSGHKPLVAGDEVITAAAGFPTTVNPIIQNGAVPVFVDVDHRTLNAEPEKVFEARTNKTRAVVLAHTLGNPYRSDLIAEWCKKENLFLVEDCCDALGAQIGNQPTGSFGHYATLSFYPAHHITMGEGGAVMSRDGRLRRIAESIRDWGRDCWCEPGKDNTCKKRFDWQLGELPCGYDHKYIYSHIGYNLKVTDMQAALGVSQLKRLPQFIEKRRAHWKFLFEAIKNTPLLNEHLIPIVATEGTTPSWFGFPMHCSPALDRHKLTQLLEEKKVGTRLVFGGDLTKQPAYKNANWRIHGVLRNTDQIMHKTFWIGVHPALDSERLNYMIEQLLECVKATLKK